MFPQFDVVHLICCGYASFERQLADSDAWCLEEAHSASG